MICITTCTACTDGARASRHWMHAGWNKAVKSTKLGHTNLWQIQIIHRILTVCDLRRNIQFAVAPKAVINECKEIAHTQRVCLLFYQIILWGSSIFTSRLTAISIAKKGFKYVPLPCAIRSRWGFWTEETCENVVSTQ